MMRKYLCSLLAGILGMAAPGFAQQLTVTLGTYAGSASTNALLSTSTTINRYSRTISLYTAAEIIAAGGTAGAVTSLAWDKYGTGEYTFGDAYIRICMKHVSNSVWSTVPGWDNEVWDATEVFTSSTFSIPTGTGWKEVQFDNPFSWNGTDNIAIFVEWYRPSMLSTDMSWGYSDNVDANATRVGSTSLEALTLLINDNRPLVQLNFNGITWDPVNSLTVQTQNNVPPAITVDDGTLQMEAVVLPATANPNVNWSIVPVTGSATINASGLLTALTDGTVWAKAVSIQDPTYKDSLLVTITNQVIPIDSIVVSTQNNVPATITTNGGSLQMEAVIYPVVLNQDVNWSLIPVTGDAAINTNGWVTAVANGTVWAKATAVENPAFSDSVLITISNQTITATDISVQTENNVPALITVVGGTLQMEAFILPANASQAVSWTIVPGTGNAMINSSGLVTAQADGTVWAKAVSVQNPALSDSMEITISNQNPNAADSVVISVSGGAAATISVPDGTLALQATVYPLSVNQNVIWSIVQVDGGATIASNGVVTAVSNGTVYAKAVAVADPAVQDSLLVTITGQETGIHDLIAGAALQVFPNPAKNQVTLAVPESVFQPGASVRVVDISGKVLRTMNQEKPQAQYDISDLPAGIYRIIYQQDAERAVMGFSVVR